MYFLMSNLTRSPESVKIWSQLWYFNIFLLCGGDSICWSRWNLALKVCAYVLDFVLMNEEGGHINPRVKNLVKIALFRQFFILPRATVYTDQSEIWHRGMDCEYSVACQMWLLLAERWVGTGHGIPQIWNFSVNSGCYQLTVVKYTLMKLKLGMVRFCSFSSFLPLLPSLPFLSCDEKPS